MSLNMVASVLLLLVLVLVSDCSAQTKIKAAPGQSVTLPCQAEGRGSVKAIEWTKVGLGSHFVLLYRDSRFDQEQQDPTYKNRVELQDKQMKNGNVSLVLRNVNANDKGRYECQVFLSGIEAPLDGPPTSIIELEVSSMSRSLNIGKIGNSGNSGNRAGPAGLMVILALLLVLRL